MIYVGIDPGIAGGIGILSDVATAYKYTSKTLIDVLKKLIETNESVKVYVEQVHSMPQQGVKSMFTFGMGYGQILGILEAMGFEYNLVKPQTWKSHVGVTADKKTSIAKAQKLFPDTSLLPTKRCRVPADGLAEALLIAYYGKQQSTGFSDKFKPSKSKRSRKNEENW